MKTERRAHVSFPNRSLNLPQQTWRWILSRTLNAAPPDSSTLFRCAWKHMPLPPGPPYKEVDLSRLAVAVLYGTVASSCAGGLLFLSFSFADVCQTRFSERCWCFYLYYQSSLTFGTFVLGKTGAVFWDSLEIRICSSKAADNRKQPTSVQKQGQRFV